MPGRTTARGYDAEYQRLRRQWANEVATGTVNCWRCHQPIKPDKPWDLGHDDHNRDIIRGPEHPTCNRTAAAHKRWGQSRRTPEPHPGYPPKP